MGLEKRSCRTWQRVQLGAVLPEDCPEPAGGEGRVLSGLLDSAKEEGEPGFPISVFSDLLEVDSQIKEMASFL